MTHKFGVNDNIGQVKMRFSTAMMLVVLTLAGSLYAAPYVMASTEVGSVSKKPERVIG
ncbi:MAG: hypothetical protein ACJAUG_003501 [Halioglobus sp.]|jgi:hypothetical protein